MKKLAFLFALFLIFSCNEKQPDLLVKTNIKGLKKGIVYLKKAQDSTIVTVDSVIVSGNDTFELQSSIKSPEIFFLYLDKNSNEEDRITFFADKGVIEINTTLKNFVFDAKIKGSKQQKTLEEYQLLMSRLNNRNLDLIKESFEAQKRGDSLAGKIYEEKQNSLLKNRYLQTVNFALNNNDSEVAPYLALTEIYNARVKFLDTINKMLTPEVKASKYGKQLQTFIDKIKNQENDK
ncbi:DUF4369 domain-containing protein [uncultured Algibacter sp.]|uniref:DUF4369 domain-containing protein n=1 Tax=uncultured Algibacter sp. TaxID=298659 RepID=UPI0026255E50|nr:DUF4369 domain-containing protein [uncultured Algibacter sp.]